VLWLLLGNCTTRQVEDALRARAADILAFETDSTADVLTIS
jgi:predicted nuclease of predicted toxin-antitoxin system